MHPFICEILVTVLTAAGQRENCTAIYHCLRLFEMVASKKRHGVFSGFVSIQSYLNQIIVNNRFVRDHNQEFPTLFYTPNIDPAAARL